MGRPLELSSFQELFERSRVCKGEGGGQGGESLGVKVAGGGGKGGGGQGGILVRGVGG